MEDRREEGKEEGRKEGRYEGTEERMGSFKKRLHHIA